MEDFGKLLEEHWSNNKLPEQRSIISAEVLQVSRDFVVVNVGAKKEAHISCKEFEQLPVVGDFINVYVEKSSSSQMVLSFRKALKLKNQVVLEEAFQKQTPLQGTITKVLENGFLVSIMEYETFLPLSQVGIFVKTPEEKESLKNKVMDFIILKFEVGGMRNKIIVSHKEILNSSKNSARSEFLKTVSIGDTLEGVVKKLNDKSALVEVAPQVTGLIRLSDISWERIKHPSDKLELEQVIKITIIDIDMEKNQLLFSIKDNESISWEEFTSSFNTNDTVEGTIVDIKDSFMILHIKGGIKGLLHQSNIDWLNPNIDLKKNFSLNQKLKVQIFQINSAKRQISLNLKQLSDNPWDSFLKNNPIKSQVKATVIKKQDNYLLLSTESNLTAMLRKKDVSWKLQEQDLSPFKEGDVLECYVLGADPREQKIYLSLKEPSSDPWDSFSVQFKAGDTIDATVIGETNNGVMLLLDNTGVETYLPYSQIPKNQNLEKDSKTKVLITEFKPHSQLIKVSIKALHESEEKAILSEYMDQENNNSSHPTFSDILSDKYKN